MPQKRVREFNYRVTGDVGFGVIQENFQTIQENIDTINEMLELITKRDYAYTRMGLVEYTAPITLLQARDHDDSKLISAFVIAADNLNMDQTLRMVKVKGNANIVEPRTIKATEKSGKTQPFKVVERMQISRYESVEILPSSNRKVVVVANFMEVTK